MEAVGSVTEPCLLSPRATSIDALHKRWFWLWLHIVGVEESPASGGGVNEVGPLVWSPGVADLAVLSPRVHIGGSGGVDDVEVLLVVEVDDDSLLEVSSSKLPSLEQPARARRAALARAAKERRIFILERSFREA